MKLDVPATVGKVTRKLDKIERDGREAWRLTATRLYDTGIDDAWNALTDPERIPRWFLPISGDLEVGGRYQLKGNAGGVIEVCNPPHELALTWEMHGDVSWVTVELALEGEKTRLTLVHVARVPEAIFDQFGPGGVGVGWDLALMGLGIHFESGAPVDPQEAQAWVVSSEGRPYVALSSESWAEASIAAGTDRIKAEASAARVTEFYSPQTRPG